MKFAINFRDEFELVFALAQDSESRWEVRAMFGEFLGRRGKPHLSWLGETEDGWLTPHFTAFHGRPTVFRRTLAKFRPEALAKFGERAGHELARTYLTALVPVSLEDLEREGWHAHWADPPTIARWLRPHCYPGARLRLDERVAEAFVCHILRHRANPTTLSSVSGPACLPILRWRSDAEEPEIKMLMHFPNGVAVPAEDGSLVALHSPGWFLQGSEWDASWAERVFPAQQGRRVFSKIADYVSRFPKRKTRDLESVPKFVSFLLGMYAGDLINLAMALTVDAANKEGSPAEARCG